ncbi:class I SAM-dependent methyltransferase [Deinococcus sp.]|uniref:SAM-dependent methyltransferase n=1 Tax=Deinococcus sp. TaxID=47478 RepID=UPI0025BA8BDE|nr:class I SAM-dependent methyltransferase [Deinococcus sp.]
MQHVPHQTHGRAALATAGAALIARPALTDTETLDATRTLLRAALPSVRPFDVQLWNGEVIGVTQPSRARLILNSPETLGRLLKLPPDVALSEAQLHEARARAEAAGVADRVTFELRDYRDVLAHTPEGSFDKIASVGMAEHVGRKNMPIYFRAAYAALKPGGLMMNHAISDGIPQARVPL